MNFHNAEFIRSAAIPEDILTDSLPKIVFSGKSNVGKSSVINRLLNRKQFARVSSTPGKTIHINYFLIDKKAYLVDLPGYGYAKTAKSEHTRWSGLMESFFSLPEEISLGILIIDARHLPTADDVMMARWYKSSGRSFIVLVNKIDKVNNSAHEQNIKGIREVLELNEKVKIISFSALKGTGKSILLGIINESLGV